MPVETDDRRKSMTQERLLELELPSRLRAVVETAAMGHSDKEIALRLGLSVHTVDSHWRRLRDVFGAVNRAETVAKFLAWCHEQALKTFEARHEALTHELAELHADRERLSKANARLQTELAERDALSVRMMEATAQAGWKDAHERERLLRLEEAVEATGTMVYEGEVGGLWRKRWATRNLEAMGYSAEEFVAGSVRVAEIVPGEDLMAIFADFERAQAAGESVFACHYRLRRPDGSVRWLRDRMALVRDESGRVVRYYGAATDVTDLVEGLDPSALRYR